VLDTLNFSSVEGSLASLTETVEGLFWALFLLGLTKNLENIPSHNIYIYENQRTCTTNTRLLNLFNRSILAVTGVFTALTLLECHITLSILFNLEIILLTLPNNPNGVFKLYIICSNSQKQDNKATRYT
jgi:hypothetical protein